MLPLWDYLTFLGLLFLFYGLRQSWSPEQFFSPGRFLAHSSYICCVLAAIALTGGYRMRDGARRLGMAAELMLAIGVGGVVGFFLLYAVLTRTAFFSVESRTALVLATTVFVLPAIAVRAFLSLYRERVARGRPYLLLGKGNDIRDFIRNYSGTGLRNPLIAVCLEKQNDLLEVEGVGPVPALPLDGLDWEPFRDSAESVIVCTDLQELPSKLVEELVRLHFRDLPVLTLSAFYESMWRKVPTLHLDYSWALHCDFNLAERSNYRFVKRAFDLTVAGLLLVATFPLMLVLALVIKLWDGGPVFFRQVRVGRGRRSFLAVKFRTMRTGAEKDGDYTQPNDPRVTRPGHWLRLTRLDELPQLINVLRGEMSLIGPRAEWVRLVERYEQEIPCYHLRHLVKPGITGWAQLNYPYGSNLSDTVEKLKYDLYYIEHYSPVLDLEILLKTALAIVTLKGR